MTQVATGSALGLKYGVFTVSGGVEATDTRSETEVTGSISGGGGMSYQGTGGNAPVSGRIESKTTRFQNIFLKEDDGTEHTVELVNFLVPCNSSQRLTLFGVTHGNNEYGSWFRAYNHNSRNHYEHMKALRDEMFPRLSFRIALAVIAVLTFFSANGEPGASLGSTLFLTLIVGLIAAGILFVIGSIIGFIRATIVRGDADYKRAVNEVQNVKPAAMAANPVSAA